MSAEHHNHSHSHTSNKKVLAVSFFIIMGYMLVEIIGGWLTGSLALLSDAGHMFSDALALGLSLLAFKFGEKAVNARQTFGYKRVEILFALFNGLTLIGIALFIIIEAVERFNNPPEVASAGMLAVSAIGLLVNIIVAWYMLKNSDTEGNINMKSAYLHVLGDLLGSVGAIAAALLIMAFGWTLADPIVSILVSLLIARSGLDVLQNTLHILMQGAPKYIDQAALAAEIQAVPQVLGVHDLHLWTLTSDRHLLSAHLVLDGATTVAQAQSVRQTVERLIQAKGIAHVTLQIDAQNHAHGDSLYCHSEQNAHEHRH
ncbi:cation diffusion facilitator family transporter [Neisseria bacilliformis]|jgi:cation diffusion facilitator family transporter|uniref:cation diffusion facilitator family transporter n=1 Tax=Neisseria bacilliformis TaxID=267212 RepID=UPI0006686271|nr:cation diffusion facilitator family transporter [Neisseria bacilliformis]